jgi:tetratricopeptide (TPR) repeat protein
MRRIILYILLLYVHSGVFGQPGSVAGEILELAPSRQADALKKIFYNSLFREKSPQPEATLAILLNHARNSRNHQLEATVFLLFGEYYQEQYKDSLAQVNFHQVLSIATSYQLLNEEAEAYMGLCWQYYLHGQYPQAFELNIKANHLIENKIGYAHFPYAGRFLYDLGFFYYDFGETEKARQFLQKAIYYGFHNDIYKIRAGNLLALCYDKAGRHDSALFFYQAALAVAKRTSDSAWIGIITGNIGTVAEKSGQIDAALAAYGTDYRLSMKKKQWTSAGHALCGMANIYLKKNRADLAELKLEEVKHLLDIQPDIRLRNTYLQKLVLLYRAKGDYVHLAGIFDTALATQRQVYLHNAEVKMGQIEKKIAIEEHLSEKKLLEAERHRGVLLRNSIIIFSILLLVIVWLLFLRQRTISQNNKQLLREAKRELDTYLNSIKDKNQLIIQFQQEIVELQESHSFTGIVKEKEEIVERLRQYTILTNEQWDAFRHLFEKVHSGFFDKLRRAYPALTASEVRLLALVRLDLSRKEMAEMVGISPESVTKTRQRIRKKLELHEQMDLEEFVLNL